MKRWFYFLLFLLLVTVSVWLAVWQSPDEKLHLVACDVGQGDAILIFQGNTQILVDGGPNDAVINCLDHYLPASDRTIEMVVLTHPEKDHYGGLVAVFKSYRVEAFVSSGLKSSSEGFQVLEKLIGGGGTKMLEVKKGQGLRVGLMHLDILWPLTLDPRAVTGSPNDYSVVIELTYRDFDALLTGDIGPEVVDDVLGNNEIAPVEYLKVPHHGSKNGLTQNLLDLTNPQVAVISVGAKNAYGHPHPEVLGMLTVDGVEILRTDEKGSVEVATDGVDFWLTD
jgi:competence protein ComEC